MTRVKRSAAGFTLVEVLTALMLGALLAAVIVYAVGGGARARRQVFFASESRRLEETLYPLLCNTLRYAEVTVENGVPLLTPEGRNLSRAALTSENGVLLLRGAEGEASLGEGLFPGLQVEEFTLAYDPATRLFRGSYTITDETGSLRREASFVIRSVYRAAD